MNRDRIDGNLLFAQNAINNATNNEAIALALAEFGFDADRITEGRTLLNQAQILITAQIKEYGEQFAATDDMYEAHAEANASYMKHLKIARIALRGNRGAAESMMLNGDRSQSYSGWLNQSKAFYVNGLNTSEVLEAMARFGITKEKLEAGQALVITAEKKLTDQLKEKGEAQQATIERDSVLEELNRFINDLIGISKIALEGKPQYLEMLGVVV